MNLFSFFFSFFFKILEIEVSFIYNDFIVVKIVKCKYNSVYLERQIGSMITMYDAGNYFIHLYDKIGGKYGCSQIKLEKMLILAQADYYLQKKTDLIDDIDIVFAENCGFSLDTSNTYFRTPITISSYFVDEPLSEDDSKKTEPFIQSKIFRFDEKTLNPDTAMFLRGIFCKYASYNPRTLGKILDKIKESTPFRKLSSEHESIPFDISIKSFYEMIDESGFSEDMTI